MTVSIHLHRLFRSALLFLAAIPAEQLLAWSPGGLPPGVPIEIASGPSGVAYRVGGGNISADELDNFLTHMADADPEAHLRVMLREGGGGPRAKVLIELFARAKRAGLHNVTFWLYSESEEGRMEGPYHPGGAGIGPFYLSLTYPSPYSIEHINEEARAHLEEQLRPEVAASLRKTLIPEVVLVHLWKALVIVFVAGCLAGWLIRDIVRRRRLPHNREQRHATDG